MLLGPSSIIPLRGTRGTKYVRWGAAARERSEQDQIIPSKQKEDLSPLVNY